MNRNLKTLGLAFVAALALSALMAASASAVTEHKFTTTKEQKAHLTAAAENTQLFRGNTNEPKKFFSCNKVNIKTGTGTIEDGATEATVQPEYSDCVAVDEVSKEEVSAFPLFNECHYTFTGKTTEGNPTLGHHAAVHIKCPEGQSVELRVTAFKLKCITIPPQEIPDAVRYENETTEPSKITDVKVTATAHSIKNTTLNTFACPTASGKEETHTNGTYTGNVRVTGFQDPEHTKPTSISVSPGTT